MKIGCGEIIDTRAASSDGRSGMGWPSASAAAFGLLLLLIAGVSVHDAMLVLLNREVILEFEQNPVGRWLMLAGDGDVWPFIVLKLAGTSAVCAMLLTMYRRAERFGFGIASAVACFQTLLLMYLTFA